MNQDPGTAIEGGFTLAELLVVLAIVALVAAVTIVGLGRTRAEANEVAAVHALRTIQSAQDAFRISCGHGREYAASLPQLGAANTISTDLAVGVSVTKSRYVITLTATEPGEATDSCTNQETAAHYYATAVAEQGGGSTGFATTDGEDIWQDSTGAAPTAPFTPNEHVSRVERH